MKYSSMCLPSATQLVKLEADGQSAAHAKYLLAGLQLLQAARRDNREELLKRLDAVK
jgi:hypothetical protein